MYITTRNDSLFPYNFFRDFWNEETTLPMRSDMYLHENEYVLDVELPGVKKEDITLNYEDEYLTISVTRDSKGEKKEGKEYAFRERHYASTSRTYHIGEVDESTITASFADGVLTVKFPKDQPKTEVSHRISIQ